MNNSLSVHQYGLMFTQLSVYAHEIIKDMRSRMRLFIVVLGRGSSKEVRLQCLMVIGKFQG